MLNKAYREAIVEVLDILEHTNKQDVNKISPKFLKFLRQNASKTYVSNLDHSRKIKDMNLREETLGFLAIINKKFWTNSI